MKKFLVATLLLTAISAVAQTIPAGTAIRVRLQTTLSSFGNKRGDVFTGLVTDTITTNGMNMFPAGTVLQGRVSKVKEPRRIAGRPTIGIVPETLTLATGEKIPLSATLVDTNLHGTRVDDEGRFKGSGHDRKDLWILGGGTGGGMLIGGLSAGAVGTGVGAAIGGGAATGYWLYKRNAAVLPSGTELILELDRPLSLAPVSGQ
ncbi:MAG TPA: hypothetical protein VH088_04505 [Terriglobales bacterium]|nr:hypothetical protein [Terriglobales bacterium]